jgi:hypothetical protein
MRAGLAMVTGKHKVRSPRIDPRLPVIVTYVDGLPLPSTGQRGGFAQLELLRDRALLSRRLHIVLQYVAGQRLLGRRLPELRATLGRPGLGARRSDQSE